MSKDLRVALVHDYLVHVRGGERVFQVLTETYPNADLYTFVWNRQGMPRIYQDRGVRTSFVQQLPYSSRFFRLYQPVYPFAARAMNLRGYDLVISSSSAWAHAVSVANETALVCYCHSPFRYIWSHYDSLVGARLGPADLAFRPWRSFLRRRDRRAATRVDAYIANSMAVKERIKSCYGRNSTVIHPPVDLDLFVPSHDGFERYYLIVSALMRYKRIDIAVQAFTRLGLPLTIVGTGEDQSRLQSMAGPSIKFLGARSDQEIARLYSRCLGFIFTAEEDFGITPLEAMAAGRPVIAYAAGGALETVVDGTTGQFFSQQTPDSLIAAILSNRCAGLDPGLIRQHAESFGIQAFQARIRSAVSNVLEKAASQSFASESGRRPL